MSDIFENQGGVSGPFVDAVAISPSDTEDLLQPTRALWVGAKGDVTITTVGGSTVYFAGYGPGWLPGRVRRVHATGTTATSMIGVW
ncbi:hypothetical protein IC608_15045 [Devosia sp. PTR5]|uniref:Uncharacterized protein n=1 Tax=Devosia oryzisoli TaxID=2774138 RepID=A0A927FY55_9HYPH|nr:hypothetical protein [Devosia oryzisoli]MBD8066789.1 hypothetical protein [Devosia oryzisoli]